MPPFRLRVPRGARSFRISLAGMRAHGRDLRWTAPRAVRGLVPVRR